MDKNYICKTCSKTCLEIALLKFFGGEAGILALPTFFEVITTMKYIKILICVLLLSLGLVFQGEEYESYINSLGETIYPSLYLQYDEVEINDAESVINDLVKKSEKFNVALFSERNESKSKTCNKYTFYISNDSVREKLYEDNYVREGVFGSLLSGDFSVSYKSFDNMDDINKIYSFNIVGAEKDIDKFVNAVTEKYDFFSYASSSEGISNQESEVYFIWTVIAIIVLSLTVFEIVSKKKEFSVRWCFGESREKNIVTNIVTDFTALIGLYIVLGKLISFVTPCTFMYTKSLMILTFVCIVNSAFWMTLFFSDIKNSIKGKEINKSSLVCGVMTKVFVMSVGIILLSDFMVSLASYTSLSDQKDFFEDNKNYSYVSVSFSETASEGHSRSQKELNFYRNVFDKADACIQSKLDGDFELGNKSVLYFNKNAEKYLLKNLKMETFSLKNGTIYTFIPEKYRTELTDKEINEFGRTVAWLIDSSEGLTYNYETIYYPENVRLIAMSNGKRKSTSEFYKDPIVVLNTTDEARIQNEITGDVNITIANSHIMYDLSKINLDKELSVLGFDPSVDSVLKTNILDDYNYRLSSISHDFAVELMESCIAILLIIVMQYIFIKSEMTYKAKEFAIKSSLGYTKAEKYRVVVLIEFVALIISLAVGFAFGNAIHTGYQYILTAFTLITAIDFVSIIFFINKIEKAKVVRLIKGASL